MKITDPFKLPKYRAINLDSRVNLPIKFLRELNVEVGDPVEVKIKAGKLVIRPLKGEEAEDAQQHITRRPRRSKK